MEYKLDTESKPDLLYLCRGENVLQRYGKMLAQRRFETAKAGEAIAFVSVEATDDQLWPALVAELNQCEPESTTESSDSLTVLFEESVTVVDGPALGDDSLWFVRQSSITSTSGYAPEPSASPGILVRSDHYVFEISGPLNGDQETLERYAMAALGSIAQMFPGSKSAGTESVWSKSPYWWRTLGAVRRHPGKDRPGPSPGLGALAAPASSHAQSRQSRHHPRPRNRRPTRDDPRTPVIRRC